MLPALDCLSLHTGEFYPLSQAEVDALNDDGEQEPFSTEPHQKDVDEYGLGGWRRLVPGVQPNEDPWHTFRVRSTEPSADGTYKYRHYRAESLWRWHKTNPADPITREPIWYEDWRALRSRRSGAGLGVRPAGARPRHDRRATGLDASPGRPEPPRIGANAGDDPHL